ATLKSSGRCVMQAPINNPPFDPPCMASLPLLVYLFLISHSPALMKSSNTFCFFSSMPLLCHCSPYSLPPRMHTLAYTPPCSKKKIMEGLKLGVVAILKPPYPYISAGLLPFNKRPLRYVTNTGTFVPSLLGTKTCFTS